MFGEAIELGVRIHNTTGASLFVVTGPPYIWRTAADRVAVLLGETAPADGLSYYGYVPPSVRSVGAARSTSVSVSVGMPPREGSIDTDGDYSWVTKPVSGDVTIEVRVGYLRQRFRPTSNAPWAEFLAAQSESPVARTTVFVERR